MTVRETYENRFDTTLQRLAIGIENLIRDYLQGVPRIDRVGARAKLVDRFVAKSEKLKDGRPKYSHPLTQIQDQIGARIITFYLSDVVAVAKVIDEYFRAVETKQLVPESEWEFGMGVRLFWPALHSVHPGRRHRTRYGPFGCS